MKTFDDVKIIDAVVSGGGNRYSAERAIIRGNNLGIAQTDAAVRGLMQQGMTATDAITLIKRQIAKKAWRNR